MSKKLTRKAVAKGELVVVKCEITAAKGVLNVANKGFAPKALLIVLSDFSLFTFVWSFLQLFMCFI